MKTVGIIQDFYEQATWNKLKLQEVPQQIKEPIQFTIFQAKKPIIQIKIPYLKEWKNL